MHVYICAKKRETEDETKMQFYLRSWLTIVEAWEMQNLQGRLAG